MPVLDFPRDTLLDRFPAEGRLAIVDLEFTSWVGAWQRRWSNADEWREIVQIGAIVVEADAFVPACRSFECLVRPARNPTLSDYFTDLTGIRQADVDREGVTFAAGLARLTDYLSGVELVIFNGDDGQILRENCAINDVDYPLSAHSLRNFRPLLAEALGIDPAVLTSSELPALAGLAAPSNAHTAADDCKSIADSLSVWRSQGRL